MIASMTAFSRKQADGEWGNLTWELRSVNHRYLEPNFKLPDALRHIEPRLREALKKHVSRGKFDCSLKYVDQAGGLNQLSVNPEYLDEVLAAVTLLERKVEKWAKLNPLELLQFPGVLADPQRDNEELADTACKLFNECLAELVATRKREGTELASFIQQRLDAIEVQVGEVRRRMPEILGNQRQRLIKKLEDIAADLDVDRLEQELVYAAQKADVDEELDRLETHVNEVRRILDKGGSCGRRLDFLMQELNREANTLSSKSLTADTTLGAVELKVLIEQMREQVQNIE